MIERGALSRRRSWQHWAWQAAILLAIAFAFRARQLGNPVIQVDEQFYLLVGDRLLHGTLPYVDIWDRKPIGLFLIYAATRLLGGAGILQYQIVATLFVAMTALAITRFATRFASALGALASGILYIVSLSMLGGDGGQAPVFYNLFMAVAATLAYEAIAAPPRRRRLGCAAMLLVGLALQIKYSVVFEGVFFGLALMWANYRAGRPIGPQAIDAALWIACALLPTALAVLVYAALGELHSFVFANFISIFHRAHEGSGIIHGRLKLIFNRLAPLMLSALVATLWQARRLAPAARKAHHFAVGWALAAAAGFLLFGTYFDHYALPLIVPTALVAAPLFGYRLLGPILALAIAVQTVRIAEKTITTNIRHHGNAATTARLVEDIRRYRHGDIFVINADPILYYYSGASWPTRYAFTTHLFDLREAPSLGVDQLTELARVMALRPSVVVTAVQPTKHANPAVVAFLARALSAGYRLVDWVKLADGNSQLVYVPKGAAA